MASVPKCSLCRITEPIEKYFSDKKKNFLVYSVFFVLLIEAFTFVFNLFYTPIERPRDFYSDYIYVFLTQVVLLLYSVSLFLWRERLHFCLRKATAIMYLSVYYLFGSVSVLFCLTSESYYNWVSGGLLTLVILLFVQSLYTKK